MAFYIKNRLRDSLLWPAAWLLAISFWLGAFSEAKAASLYFSPASGSYGVGQTFSISVYTGSTDQAMNAASGAISFPPDKVEVTSISKTGSIVSLWVQEPSYSNGAGTVNFEGIVLNPGYVGSAGKIIGVTLRAKQAGVATLSFTSSSVLANDGKGTNILTGIGTASFSIGGAVEESTTPAVGSGTPHAPKITSTTHPDPSKWYAKNNVTVQWEVTPDATGSRVLYDKFPYSQPSVSYNASVSSRELTNIADGIWYFHAQLSNANGRGAISNFRFQIDTEKPEYIEVGEIFREDKTEPQIPFNITARDTTSGIDHYEIKIDDQPSVVWKNGELYKTKATLPGDHTILVKAYDKAGNYVTDTAEFSVEPLTAPVVTSIKKEINEGEPLSLQGKTLYHNLGDSVLVKVQREGVTVAEDTINVINPDGTFTYVYDHDLKEGTYNLWLRAQDARGAESNDSAKVNFAVISAGFFSWGGIVINYLSVILTIMLLFGGIAVAIMYGLRKITGLRGKIKEETSEAQVATTRAFATLREEVKKQIAMLDGKAVLSESEKRIYGKLKEALNISERYIARKIKDINGR